MLIDFLWKMDGVGTANSLLLATDPINNNLRDDYNMTELMATEEYFIKILF